MSQEQYTDLKVDNIIRSRIIQKRLKQKNTVPTMVIGHI